MRHFIERASHPRKYASRIAAIMLALVLAWAQPSIALASTDTTPQTTPANSESSQPTTTAPAAPTTESSSSQPAPATQTTSAPTESKPSPTPASTPTATKTNTSNQTSKPTTSTSASNSSSTGPQRPTGDEGTAYTYNSTTGLWESDKYTWDPVTKKTAPKATPDYSYNPATGMWDTVEWRFDTTSGKYVPNTVSVTVLPPNAQINPSSPITTQEQAEAVKSGALKLTDSDKSTSNSAFDLFYNASISNNITGDALSGDAIISRNTLAGNALSGTALTMANIINILQSSWAGLSTGGLTTFIASLFGNVFGDIILNPTSESNSSATSSGDTAINVTSGNSIENNVNLSATSGNAVVSGNTTAGDATSGDAFAIANIINAIASSISTGSSFVGVLNIFGNLNGDILLPTQLRNLLGSSSSSKDAGSSTTAIDSTTNQTVTTEVDSQATTGQASVEGNTSAGNATSGEAKNILNVINLTGKQVIGQNALLVFVNVLGNWIGLIVDTPTGSTSAILGDTSSTTQSLPASTDTAVDVDETQSITNNVTLEARSGDATVTDNTTAGNASSGSAATIANVVNIANSTFSLANWFGVLFINIFGDWTGSFGVDTSAGETPSSTRRPVIRQPDPANLPVWATSSLYIADNSLGLYTSALYAEDVDNGTSSPAPSTSSDRTEHEATLAATSGPSDSSTTGGVANSDRLPQVAALSSLLMAFIGSRLLFRNHFSNSPLQD